MKKAKHLHKLLNRLSAAEEQFFARPFLAPVVRHAAVQVRLAGVRCRFHVQPADFTGWGVFQPTSPTMAQLVRRARLAEQRHYLELFPLVRLILAEQRADEWFAVPAQRGDRRLRIAGMVPVHLVEEGRLFDAIQCRFDGVHFWYAGGEPCWDAATGAYLRQALTQKIAPENLHRPGLTAEERDAYAIPYVRRWHGTEAGRRQREQERLRQALAHAGAELKDYLERDDTYTVTYEVDGERHVSVVARQDLSVQAAGICLSGEDDHFDLHSLVGVLREARLQNVW